MFRNHAAAAAMAVLMSVGGQAAADEFMLELEGPMTQDDTALMQSLRLSRIDAFEHDTRHFVVIEARDDAAVEAYFRALKLSPVSMMPVRLDWRKLSVGGLSRQQSMGMLAEGYCGFCVPR